MAWWSKSSRKATTRSDQTSCEVSRQRQEWATGDGQGVDSREGFPEEAFYLPCSCGGLGWVKVRRLLSTHVLGLCSGSVSSIFQRKL